MGDDRPSWGSGVRSSAEGPTLTGEPPPGRGGRGQRARLRAADTEVGRLRLIRAGECGQCSLLRGTGLSQRKDSSLCWALLRVSAAS